MTTLSSCIKKYTYDADKAIHPKVTVDNAIRSLKQEGINFELNDITSYYPLKIPAYTCVQTNKQIGGPMGGARSWGKGFTDEQAKASALMELIERRTGNQYYANKNNAQEESKTVFKSWDAIEDDKISIDSIINYTTAKENSENIKKTISRKNMTYTKFYSLTEKKWKFFPFGWHLYFNGTNGLAAGNTPEEAILAGLYEVIERHNTAKSLHKPTKRIDIEKLKNTSDILKELLDQFERLNIRLYSMGEDIAISTVYCAFMDKNEKGIFRYNHGRGTFGRFEIAAIRAITEASSMIHQKKYSEKQNIPHPSPSFSLYPILSGELIDVKIIDSIKKTDILEEIETVISILKKQGFEVLFKNMTSKELKIPVVYVACTNTMICDKASIHNTSIMTHFMNYYDSDYLTI